MREPRLGDDIDDYCVRCKRIMNHAIVSVINGAPAKVRCRTCHSDHDFRHEQAPPPKVDTRKAALYSEVLKKVNPEAAAAEVPETDLLDTEVPLEQAEAESAGSEAPPAAAAAPAAPPAAPPPGHKLAPSVHKAKAPAHSAAAKPAAKTAAKAAAKTKGKSHK